MKRTAVIDSSALISLIHLELARKLSLFFQFVYIPRSVQTEVNRKSRFRYRLNKLYNMDIFKRCAAGNEFNILLLKELNRGEAEAIVQAQEIGATFLIADERPAREIGERHGLRSVGTLRLIARLHLEGYAGEPAGAHREAS